MSGPLLNRNQLLLVKVETNYGVDATPVASANTTLTFPVDTSLDIAQIQQNAVRASISAQKKRLGRKMVNFTITTDLKGSGAAGTPPEIGALLQACGYAQTIDTGVSVIYKPVSAAASMKSVTIYFYYDGRLRKAVGCMGNVSINTPPGETPTITFTMRGKLVSDADASLPASSVVQSTVPVVVESAGMSFGSFDAAVVRSFQYDSGNNLVDRSDINSAEGVAGTFLTERDPKWTATVEATTEATKTWVGNLEARTEEALDITIGTVAGNIVTLTMPKCTIDGGTDPKNDNGMIVFNLSGAALENAGNDNIEIKFT